MVLWLFLACALDSDLAPKDGAGVFDTGDAVPDTDTDTRDSAGHTGLVCEDQAWPAADVERDAACHVDGDLPGVFDPVVEWHNADPGFVVVAPVVGRISDTNRDGMIDERDPSVIVVSNTMGQGVALDGNGVVLWAVEAVGIVSGLPDPWSAFGYAPVIGDVDLDGVPDVVFIGDETVAVNGQGVELWRVPTPLDGNADEIAGCPALVDADADGTVEVWYSRWLLNGEDGTIQAEIAAPELQTLALTTVADLDLDGVPEQLLGSHWVHADGTSPVLGRIGNAGLSAVANFDADPYGEVVVADIVGHVSLFDHDGAELWSVAVGVGLGAPAIVDVDGDGTLEIAVPTVDGLGLYGADGVRLWFAAAADTSGSIGLGVAAFDFEGDGSVELVYADSDTLWVFDGPTGGVKLEEPSHGNATISEMPVIADVDGDGSAEIVTVESTWTDSTAGVTVIGSATNSWRPARPFWNQWGYNITNIDADGTVPAAPTPGWAYQNSYRAAELTRATGYDGVDLVPVIQDVCADACLDGRVVVWISLENQGYADADAGVEVEVWAELSWGAERLTVVSWPDSVPAGTRSASVAVELEVAPPVNDLWVVVDPAGARAECDEADNTVWWGAVCI